jgi:glycosyltransferase involved in cell wall biosynthesis
MENLTSTDPLVSICIPAYNSETTIGRTIESVIGQTYNNIEIIVVDNLSTDATLDHVREYKDSRIRIVENPVHFCCAEYNWNTCFAHTRGEFIALFHADDVYSPDIVSRQVDAFRKFPSVMGVFTEADVIDEKDKIIDTFTLPSKITGNIPHTYRELLPAVLEYGAFLLCPSAMVRRDTYKNLAPFRYDQFGSAADLDMWLRVAKTGPVIIIDQKLLKYRISAIQWSATLKSRTRAADGFKVLDFHTAEIGADSIISGDTLGKYELRRMEDQIFCSINFLKKQDFSGFRQHMNQMAWRKYIRIIITKPRLSLPFLFRGFCKVPKNIKS